MCFLRVSVSLCAGDVLFQMAEVHRQIQVQLEEMVGILSSKWLLVEFFRTNVYKKYIERRGKTKNISTINQIFVPCCIPGKNCSAATYISPATYYLFIYFILFIFRYMSKSS